MLLAKEIFDIAALANAAIYSVLGLLIFGVFWLLIVWLTPFSIRKEIEDDQNVALSVIMAGVTVGIAIIIAAAIHG